MAKGKKRKSRKAPRPSNPPTSSNKIPISDNPSVLQVVDEADQRAARQFPKQAEVQVVGENGRRFVTIEQVEKLGPAVIGNPPEWVYPPSKIDWKRF